MLGVCDNQRDRALIFTLYESGLRASELLSLKIKNIQFDRYGAVIILPRRGRKNGLKTGQRRIRLFDSMPQIYNYGLTCTQERTIQRHHFGSPDQLVGEEQWFTIDYTNLQCDSQRRQV